MHQEVARRLTLADYVGEALSRTWLYRVPGLIHGDCHRRNLIASKIIDWESVALVDPYEESALSPWRTPGRGHGVGVAAMPMTPLDWCLVTKLCGKRGLSGPPQRFAQLALSKMQRHSPC